MSRLRALCALVIVLAISVFAHGESQITSSGTTNAFYSSTQFYTHCANGHYWTAFHDGTDPVIWSSPDGATWTSQLPIFPSFSPAADGRWAVRYVGNTIIAFGYNSGDTNRYYNKGTLNADGSVTWDVVEALVTGVSGATNQELNALIVNGKPVMWRAGPFDAGRFTIGDQLDAPITWTDTADAPALAPTTAGQSAGGAIFPAGGSDPDDLIVLRATTTTPDTLGSHRLVALKYDAGGAGFDGAWYDVSTLGGGPESNTTEVKGNAEAAAHRHFGAVRDTSGNIHAVYVNQNQDAVHYKKDVGFNNSWSVISTDVTQTASNVSKIALSAAANDNLHLYYEKNDFTIYYRRFDGTAWGPENQLYSGPDLRQALAPVETAVGCSQAIAWAENTGPHDVMFSLEASPCAELGVAESGGRVRAEAISRGRPTTTCAST